MKTHDWRQWLTCTDIKPGDIFYYASITREAEVDLFVWFVIDVTALLVYARRPAVHVRMLSSGTHQCFDCSIGTPISDSFTSFMEYQPKQC